MSTLYIVATPIGNLQDFSPRAVEVLKSVEYIACEDTRTSGNLLQHFGIDKPTFSFHQHNEHRKVGHLMNILDANQDVALISDAGMPGISDPGFLATRAAKQGGHNVTVIPGPDAATTAVVASGLPCDRYIFEGFLPHKKGRQKRLKQLSEEELTIIIYESPNRLLKLLGEIEKHFEPERLAAVARELTKKFEEVVRGTIAELKTEFENRDAIKGEVVVVISGKGYSE
ncbi:16S rRNA (cytidine(1402)-2'-O)-methyltransferase [Gracilimonas mengyeensis]|uniref:Ribosomal RNA small subunit methyltransferase I n=1 Tax=Gracilimonas mengyeensis TaxID=1302730 RepID=A0A521AZY0_9BACT|nr:16S rRNA (cytidine(1402)-2'-O)-methyltransferase [Gracilimonas mengyeensis]SMO40345.1 16S rRNA (cytidine1402-2'-O)-methyltransferase [Gracilimonas mengyeensis]